MRISLSDRLVAAKRIVREEKGESVSLRNPSLGTTMTGPKALLTVLEFFASPQTVQEFFDTFEGVEAAVLDRLVGKHLLFREQDERMLRQGALVPPSKPVGVFVPPPEFQSLRRGEQATHAFAVLGAPVDVAAGQPGARHGPRVIRGAMPFDWPSNQRVYDLDRRKVVDVSNVQTVDVGDVVYCVGESVRDFGARLGWVAEQIHAQGFTPVCLGGDHSITRFLLRPLLARNAPFGIIHFDAHSDLFETDGDEVTHANPFDEALQSPHLERLFQIGLRQLLSGGGTPRQDQRLQWVSARECRHTTASEMFAQLRSDIPYYLTFDVDCMDPMSCPETGDPIAGGLQLAQVSDYFSELLARFTIVGADFVEVTGTSQPFNGSAHVVAQLLAQVLLAHGSASELTSQLFRR